MNPYLSVVLTGRNDNYGGDFIKRLQDFFDWNCALFESFKVDTEIIFINWNPLEKQDSIEKLIQFPKKKQFVRIRIITISAELHEKFIIPSIRQTVPIFEFIAKNVGIRRAMGEFVLSLNADVLLHPKIVETIATKQLKNDFYYRANRLDFKTINEIKEASQLYENGVFISLKGFKYSLNQVFPVKLQITLLAPFNRVRLKWELTKKKYQKTSQFFGFSITHDNSEYQAHCLNSGDFMLMHYANWMKLKSYPEKTFVSTHTDALFTIFAYSQLKEFVFDKPIFHQEHERRYTSKLIDENPEIKQAYRNFQKISQEVLQSRQCERYLNTDDWGLNDYNLDEIIIE